VNREAVLEKALLQIACPHKGVSGGNDYLMCWDCGLEWDYGKRNRPSPAEIATLAVNKGLLFNCNILSAE
jgi:hypothetical protein